MMHRSSFAVVAGSLLALLLAGLTAAETAKTGGAAYPVAPKGDVVEDYHGTKVSDPYRPLEDPDSKATRAWVEAENKVTFAFLESIPARAALKERLQAVVFILILIFSSLSLSFSLCFFHFSAAIVLFPILIFTSFLLSFLLYCFFILERSNRAHSCSDFKGALISNR